MKLTDKLSPSPDVVAREVGGESVLLNLESGTYFGLSGVGGRIWQLLEEESRTLAELCKCIVADFDVQQDEAERDILALAEELVKHDLVALSES